MSNCIYCNSSSSAGQSCQKSPTKGHVKNDPGKCSYCGSSSSAGQSCQKSPSRGHVHGVFQ